MFSGDDLSTEEPLDLDTLASPASLCTPEPGLELGVETLTSSFANGGCEVPGVHDACFNVSGWLDVWLLVCKYCFVCYGLKENHHQRDPN